MQFWQARLVDSLLIHCAAQQYRSTTLLFTMTRTKATHHTVLNSNQPLCLTCLCYNTSKTRHDPTLRYFKRHGQSCKATKASLFAKTAYNWITSYLWEGSCMHLFVLMFVHAHVPCLDFRDSESQLKTYHGKMGNNSVFAKSWKPRCILCTVYNVVIFGYSIQTRKEGGPKEVQNMNIDDIGNFWGSRLVCVEVPGDDPNLGVFHAPILFKRWSRFQKNQTTRGKNHPDGIHQGRKRLLRLKIKTSINRNVATICYSPNCHNGAIVPRFNDGLHGSCR